MVLLSTVFMWRWSLRRPGLRLPHVTLSHSPWDKCLGGMAALIHDDNTTRLALFRLHTHHLAVLEQDQVCPSLLRDFSRSLRCSAKSG